MKLDLNLEKTRLANVAWMLFLATTIQVSAAQFDLGLGFRSKTNSDNGKKEFADAFPFQILDGK